MKSGIDPEARILSVDNTALELFRKCPMKFFWRIQNDLMPLGEAQAEHPSLALHYGTAWHSALDVLYKTKSVDSAKEQFEDATDGMEEDPYNKRTIGRGIRDLDEYVERYGDEIESLQLIETEAHVRADVGQIIPPDGGDPWTLWYHGAIDKIIKMDTGKIRIRDHKTTASRSMHTATSYHLANQMLGYAHGVKNFFGIDDEVIVDVDIVVLAKVRETEFLRPEMLVDDARLVDWSEGIIQTGRMIVDCYNRNVFPQYGREACMAWGKQCEFFDLCDASKEMQPAIAQAQYTQKPWDPEER